VVDDKPAGSARVQRFVIPPSIVTRNGFSVTRNGSARRSLTTTRVNYEEAARAHHADKSRAA
ncbi:MAG TPA: hypothetical protein DC054_16235, partial [Blastocatellia bacterium]|nr:hypothetical protein [Blastocatellia bacterium]